LSALLSSAPVPSAPAPRGFLTVPIEQVLPERDQPRRFWDVARLEELAASIKARGVIQPILVRRMPEGNYRIVAGERRWRAAQQAGLSELPVIVKEVSEAEAFELALIENIQRMDLNPIEEAEAYQRLLSEHGLKQDDLATRVGKDRSSVANALRLLKLPPVVREQVAGGSLSVGHAKVLLGVDDAKDLSALAHQVTERGLSVRDTERLVQRWKSPPVAKPRQPLPADLRTLTRKLEKALDVPCSIEMKSATASQLTIRFSTVAKAHELLHRFLAEAAHEARSQQKEES
jgi:ParB family chromosome partitioning protein